MVRHHIYASIVKRMHKSCLKKGGVYLADNMIRQYQIGECVFEIVSDLPYSLIDANAVPFEVEGMDADYVFRFQKCTDIPKLIGRTRIVEEGNFACEMLNEHQEHIRGFFWKDRLFDSVLRKNGKEYVISYVSSSIIAERRSSGFNFTNYFALENIFLWHGGLILHSSHVNVKGHALLFSAPSGTGKSTQADLWEKHAGAEVMNGDRTLLRKKDGVWHAYGCPMCGTSGIHKQGNESIHAIVMLSQGTDNSVRRLTPGEAFQRMYPEITVPKWNRELVLRAMELLDDVMANVPIYAFSCTKDERAVTALREAIGL